MKRIVAFWGVVAPEALWARGQQGFGRQLLEAAERSRIACSDRVFDGAECFIAASGSGVGAVANAALENPTQITIQSGPQGLRLNSTGASEVGVVINFNSTTRTLQLRGDYSGAFPLYFACNSEERILVFSSHQGLLAELLKGTPDEIAILQYLRNAYTVNGRSFFREFSRLQPRQQVQWSLAGTPMFKSHKLEIPHAPGGIAQSDRSDDCDELWHALRTTSSAVGTKLALMASGGWDSRTLLGALTAGNSIGERLLCYTHGDVLSRELTLVRELGTLCGAAVTGVTPRVITHAEAIRAESFLPENLNPYLDSVETALFPHWYAAGKRLHEMDIQTAQSGVFGELLGGHYGRTMLLQGYNKIRALAGELLFPRSDELPVASDLLTNSLAELIVGSQPIVPWFVDPGIADEPTALKANYSAEISTLISQYREAGLRGVDSVLEWFIAEHRGSQYIAAQALSMRPWVDISLPFADPRLLALVQRFEFSERVHNRLNQRLLRRYSPMLLELPLASTLLPASSPILLLEGSRLMRSLCDVFQSKLHGTAGGFIPRPRRTWANYEFLSTGNELYAIFESLHSPIWNRAAINRVLETVRSGKYIHPLHSLTEVLLKMYTVDRIISR